LHIQIWSNQLSKSIDHKFYYALVVVIFHAKEQKI
jgi:hypothetical protein